MSNTICIYENARLNVTYLFGQPVRFEADKAAQRDDILRAYLEGGITQELAKQLNVELESQANA